MNPVPQMTQVRNRKHTHADYFTPTYSTEARPGAIADLLFIKCDFLKAMGWVKAWIYSIP